MKAGDLELTWSPGRRVAELRCTRPGAVGGDGDAAELIAWLAPHVAAAPRFALWVDSRGVSHVSQGWRSRWLDYLTSVRDKVVIAWWGPNAAIRTIIRMFLLVGNRRGNALAAAVFETEAEAIAWLRTHGFDA